MFPRGAAWSFVKALVPAACITAFLICEKANPKFALASFTAIICQPKERP
jgi:hypothetical protein